MLSFSPCCLNTVSNVMKKQSFWYPLYHNLKPVFLQSVFCCRRGKFDVTYSIWWNYTHTLTDLQYKLLLQTHTFRHTNRDMQCVHRALASCKEGRDKSAAKEGLTVVVVVVACSVQHKWQNEQTLTDPVVSYSKSAKTNKKARLKELLLFQRV